MGCSLPLQSGKECLAPIRTDGGGLFDRVTGFGSLVVFLNRYGLGLALSSPALGGGDMVAEGVEAEGQRQQYADCQPGAQGGRDHHLSVTA